MPRKNRRHAPNLPLNLEQLRDELTRLRRLPTPYRPREIRR